MNTKVIIGIIAGLVLLVLGYFIGQGVQAPEELEGSPTVVEPAEDPILDPMAALGDLDSPVPTDAPTRRTRPAPRSSEPRPALPNRTPKAPRVVTSADPAVQAASLEHMREQQVPFHNTSWNLDGETVELKEDGTVSTEAGASGRWRVSDGEMWIDRDGDMKQLQVSEGGLVDSKGDPVERR